VRKKNFLKKGIWEKVISMEKLVKNKMEIEINKIAKIARYEGCCISFFFSLICLL
jgi:hypothetical protein